MYKILIFCALLLQLCNIKAQECNFTFEGKVTDFHDKTPLVGASIAILNLNRYATSDINGNFRIDNLCKSKITIEIRHLACDTKQIIIDLNKSITKEIFLEHHLESLNEVVINSNYKTEKTSVEQSLKIKEIEHFTDKSLGDALQTISGVSSLNTGNSIVKPMIHGLHSSRLLIINNNVRMFDQEWGDEHAPNVDINTAGRIEVIKGANTLIYGSDAIGGLILMKPKIYEKVDSVFGSTSTSLNTNGLGGNVNTEFVKTFENGLYTKAQANFKKLGDFSAPDYNLSNSGTQSSNASFQIGFNTFERGFEAYYSYVNTQIGIIRAAHVGNVNDLIRAINRGEPSFIDNFSHTIDNPKQTIVHHLGKIDAYTRFKGLGKLSLQFDFQHNRRKEFDRRRAAFRDLAAADFSLFTTSLQPNLKIDALDNITINTGVLLRYQQNDSADESETRISIPLIPDYQKYETGIYATGTFNLNSNTEISAGFRYDFSRIEAEKKYKVFDWEENNYNDLFPEFSTGNVENFEIYTTPKFNFHNISASLGFMKQVGDYNKVFFNYGLASRMPNVSELFSNGLHHSAARIETGSLLLKKEVANKFIASYEYKSQKFGFSISPYYNYINDFIQLIPAGEALTTIRGAFIEWQYQQINAQIFGVDFDVNTNITDQFRYQGNLSLLKGDNVTENTPLIHMPSANFSNTISYSNQQLNQLTIGITQYTELRQHRFPDYNFEIFNPILLESIPVDISSPTDAFTLFHFNSAINFKISDTSNLNIAFNIENVFNVSYRNYLNRLRYFADEVGRNFNIKLKLNY